MALKICESCKSEFEGKGAQRYCSEECKAKARVKVKKCVVCSGEFRGKGNLKFCSNACRMDYYIKLNDGVSTCVMCSKQLNEKKIKRGFKTCSAQCSSRFGKLNQTPESKEQQYKKLSAIYQSKTEEQKQAIKERQKQTFRKNYGTDWGLQSKDIQDKVASTNEARYGVDNVFKLKEIRDRIKQTNLEKYGSIHVTQNAEIAKRITETHKRNFGMHFAQTDEYSNDALDKKRLELENASELSDIQTILLRGLRSATNSEIIERRKRVTDIEYVKENCFTSGKYDRNKFMEFFCYSNKMELYFRHINGFNIEYNVSLAEKNVLNALKQMFPKFDYINSNKKLIPSPFSNRFLEIDIVIKKYDTIICGIEYNGNYWHDEGEYFDGLTKEEYKTKECEKLGFPLFHIWEDTEEEDFAKVVEFLERL